MNRFKNVGKLNFDQNGLMIINLENEMDKKIDVMQSASKLLNNENDKEKKLNKKYTLILDNVPRRIKYIKEKTINEKKMFEIRKKEMHLQLTIQNFLTLIKTINPQQRKVNLLKVQKQMEKKVKKLTIKIIFKQHLTLKIKKTLPKKWRN